MSAPRKLPPTLIGGRGSRRTRITRRRQAERDGEAGRGGPFAKGMKYAADAAARTYSGSWGALGALVCAAARRTARAGSATAGAVHTLPVQQQWRARCPVSASWCSISPCAALDACADADASTTCASAGSCTGQTCAASPATPKVSRERTAMSAANARRGQERCMVYIQCIREACRASAKALMIRRVITYSLYAELPPPGAHPWLLPFGARALPPYAGPAGGV